MGECLTSNWQTCNYRANSPDSEKCKLLHKIYLEDTSDLVEFGQIRFNVHAQVRFCCSPTYS